MKIEMIQRIGEGKSLTEDFGYFDCDRQMIRASVGDWASNLVGGPYKHPRSAELRGIDQNTLLNGGVIGSTIVKDLIVRTNLTGRELIARANEEIAEVYSELGITGVERNRAKSFTGYIGHVLVTRNHARITAVGDVRIALDGVVVAGKTKAIDVHNAELRVDYIEWTGDVAGSPEYIKQNVIGQYRFQNTPGNEYSYPAIDGTITLPTDEITTLLVAAPRHILIWSDGFEVPDEFSISGLERKLAEVTRLDPSRCNRFPAVKSKLDDRTAIEIDLDGWK